MTVIFGCRACDVRWNERVLGPDCWFCSEPGDVSWMMPKWRTG